MTKKTYIINCLLILSLIFTAARPKSTVHPIVVFNIMMGLSFFVIITLWIIVIYRRKKQNKSQK
ncbi:MAG: hypothetical protein EAZ85_03825 [Bacteroidetes bacterium]|nr:MAG: hypothetical protein EAZ85_03825 [Bacteroidota bacterium]TAG88881.1 MAG: hypothetical protein EAZ20_07680 [Bacteroidota bacterium]